MSNLQKSLNATSVTETLATYDRWAAAYNRDVEAESYVAPQIATDYVVRYLKATDIFRARILDAGCGTGLVGEHLANCGARHIEGIDISTGMLEVAEKTGAYMKLAKADLCQALDTPSNSYDVLTCVGTLTQGHVGPGAMGEFIRVVKQGGILVITVRSTVWEANGYRETLEGFIREGAVRLLTDSYEMRRIANDVDLVYLPLEVL